MFSLIIDVTGNSGLPVVIISQNETLWNFVRVTSEWRLEIYFFWNQCFITKNAQTTPI